MRRHLVFHADLQAEAVKALLDLSSASYHADLVDDARPSLSKSTIHTLLTASPAHAWANHPRLNPDYTPSEDIKFDLGTAAHCLFLEGDDRMSVVPYDTWQTKAAKELRTEAREAGLTPLLAKDAERARQMVAAIRAQLDLNEAQPPLFTDGSAERTLVWEEDGVLCRARLDWLRDDLAACDDMKTTSASANPEQWCRKTLYGIAADVQAAFYQRGLFALTGRIVPFRFCVVETQPPFALSVVELGPDVLELANAKVDYALRVWKRCLAAGVWPAYPPRVATAELPGWALSQWMEREAREEAAA